MSNLSTLLRSSALATIFGLAFGALPAPAQTETPQAQQEDATDATPGAGETTGGEQATTGEDGTPQDPAGAAAGTGSDAADAVVARVGAVDIRNSDVLRAIGQLPPQFQAQPPEMLIPMAIEQLLLRQLILQEVTTQELAQESEVRAMAERAAQEARENVLVQAWLSRELDERVTDEAVRAEYERLAADATGDAPPLDQVRPQIEDALRQQAIASLSADLLESDLVVIYGPDGQPAQSRELDPQAGDAAGAEATGTAVTGAEGGTDEAEVDEVGTGNDMEDDAAAD